MEFVKSYDDRRNKERAEQVTGGVTRDAPPAGGGGFGGGGYGGGGYGGGGGGGSQQVCFDFQKGRCTRG